MAEDLRQSARERGGKSPNAFRTISEVSEEIDVPQHVLRFWETKFTQIKPLKRGGGRRYYRPEDIELLRSVRDLLYEEGYTIKGVQKILRSGGGKRAVAAARGTDGGGDAASAANHDASTAKETKPAPTGMTARQRDMLQDAIRELSELRDILRNTPDVD
jgi:DNA-binding transcriptional MerR regulator